MWRVDPEGVETQALAELARADGLRVLELGCGDGRLTWWLARTAASVVAVKVELIAASATEVDLPPGEFELALFSWSL